MSTLQDFLEYSEQADLLHRGLQGLSWKSDGGALRKIYATPVLRDLSVMELKLCLSA